MKITAVSTCGTYHSWLRWGVASVYNSVDKIIIINGGYEVGRPEKGDNIPLLRELQQLKDIDIDNKILQVKPTNERLIQLLGKDLDWSKCEAGRARNITLAFQLAYHDGADWVLKFDSVTADTYIPVRYKNRIYLRKINELHKLCDEVRLINYQGKNYYYPKDDLYILSPEKVEYEEDLTWKRKKAFELNDVNKISSFFNICKNSAYRLLNRPIKVKPIVKYKWKKIQCVISHFTDKPIYEVYDKHGYISCTKDHSLVKIENGKLKEETFENIDNLYSGLLGFENDDFLNKIDLIEWVSNYDRYDDEFLYFKTQKTEVGFKRILNKNNLFDFCKLIGWYVSEGYVIDENSIFGISLKQKNIIFDIENIIKRLSTNITTSIVEVKKENYESCWRVQVNQGGFGKFFKKLCGQGCYNKVLPDFIFNVKDEFKEVCLIAAINGDGSWINTTKFRTDFDKFNYTTTSLSLASGISFLCKLLKKDLSLGYRREKKSYCLTHVMHKRDRNTFHYNLNENYESLEKGLWDISVECDKGLNYFVGGVNQIILHNSDQIFDESFTREGLEDLANGIGNIDGYRFAEYADFYRAWDRVQAFPHNFTDDGTLFFKASKKAWAVGGGSPVHYREQREIHDMRSFHMRRISPPDVDEYEYHYRRLWYHTYGPNSIGEWREDGKVKKLTLEEVKERATIAADAMMSSEGHPKEYFTENLHMFPPGKPPVVEIGPETYIMRGLPNENFFDN
jgi:hypothetical protein